MALLDEIYQQYLSGGANTAGPSGNVQNLATLQDAAAAGLFTLDATGKFVPAAGANLSQSTDSLAQLLAAVPPPDTGTPTYTAGYVPPFTGPGTTPVPTTPAMQTMINAGQTPVMPLPGYSTASSQPTMATAPTAGPVAVPGAIPSIPGSNPMNALLEALLGRSLANTDFFSSLRDTSTGLSPATLAMLNTQALESVPQQFDRAETDLMTDLLRRGGAGGDLPAGGSFLQGFAPLQGAKEATKAQLLQNVLLQNEAEKRRTLDVNRDRAMQTIGATNSLFGAVAGIGSEQQQLAQQLQIAQLQSGTQLKLADMDAQTRLQLAQLGISNDQQLAQFNAQLQTNLANLNAGTQTNLATMNAQLQTTLAGLDSQTRLRIAEMQAQGPNFFTGTLLPSLLATLGAGGENSLIAKGLGGLMDVLGIGGTAGTAAGTTTGTAGGAGMGAAITGFLTNPITIGVGVGIAAVTAILKSQAHWEANTFVQQVENPIGSRLVQMHNQFFGLMENGPKIDRATAIQMRAAIASLQSDFNAQADSFAKGGSDETTVANQGKVNLGQQFAAVLASMDNAIAQYLPA